MSDVRHEQFDAVDGGRAEIDVAAGSVEVREGTAGSIEVTVEGPEADRWRVRQSGATVSVEPPSGSVRRVRSVRIAVVAPPGTEIDVRSASAGVVVGGRMGPIRVRTASGDVRLGDAARIRVDSASGDVRAGHVESVVECSTASGDVDVVRAGGRLDVSTASGDVRVDAADDDVVIGTASGDVRIERFGGSSIQVKCISGDVSIGLPAGIRVEPDIVTLSGRTILPTPASSDATGERRVVRVGLRTVTGDIRIDRVS